MRLFLTTLTCLLLSTISCKSQINDPLTLAKTIFARDSFPDLDKHVSGEYKGHPNGTDLPVTVSTDFLLLGQNEKTAVVNLTLTDSTEKEFDCYLHFEKDSIWKVTAFRALAMTGMIQNINKQLMAMTDAEVDSMIILSNNDTLGFSIFKSKKEYKHLLGQTGLTIASDNDLISHFKKNKSTFEVLKNTVLLEIDTLQTDQEREVKIGLHLKSNYNQLFISSISTNGFEFGTAINFLIGGMIDNTVGYLYVKQGDHVPKMNSRSIIMIREIGGGWYLYKTT